MSKVIDARGFIGAVVAAALLGLVAGPPAVAAPVATTDRTIAMGSPEPGGWIPLVEGPPAPRVVHPELAAAEPRRAHRRSSLVYFGQMSGAHLSDEESTVRVEGLDMTNSAFSSAQRAQEALIPATLDASVRAIERFARQSPLRAPRGGRARLRFTLISGDMVDSNQENEYEWLLGILGGRDLAPGSGVAGGCPGAADEADPSLYTGVQDTGDLAVAAGQYWDPDAPGGIWAAFPLHPGLLDAAQETFDARGLTRPWLTLFGNHDRLIQGNAAATAPMEAIATGCAKTTLPVPDIAAAAGASSPGAFLGLVPRDPARRHIGRAEVVDRYLSDDPGLGHGLSKVAGPEAEASAGVAAYYRKRIGRRLRLIALDTVSEAGVVGVSSEGNIDDPQFRWLQGELNRAEELGRRVIVTGHHPLESLVADIDDESAPACAPAGPPEPNPGCDQDPRDSEPIHLEPEVRELLASHPSVVAYLSGSVTYGGARLQCGPERGFWEVTTGNVSDWPQTSRLVEVMKNRDGTLSIFATSIDHSGPIAPPPPETPGAEMSTRELASLSRALAANDPQLAPPSSDDLALRNVELVVPDPLARNGPAAAPCPG